MVEITFLLFEEEILLGISYFYIYKCTRLIA